MDKFITLDALIKELKLSVLTMPESAGENGANIKITTVEVNRPGLALFGYFSFFEEKRVQVIGLSETSLLKELDPEERYRRFYELCKYEVPCIIFCREIVPPKEVIQAAKDCGRTILQTHEQTSEFTASLIAYLNLSLAPSIIQHGELVDVYGEGILILGDSGVGKSETAMELVKRGHRLVADDAVEIKRVSSKTLVGSSPPLIRHLIELRGVGLVDVRRIFGAGAVKETESIDFIVKLEPWQENTQYDRLGLENEYYEILGLKKPCVTIPIKPGRNLAVIIEVAAINNRQKSLGYNAAEDFNRRFNAGNFEATSASD